MNIYVLIKQVPDTTEMQVDKETGTLKRDGVETIINPDDLAALEEALQIKDNIGAHVTTITMGPAKAESMLRELLGYGADEAVLLSDRVFAGSDTLATSTILSSYLKDKSYDLIIAGRQAIDGDTAQVGPQIAELLDVEQITYVNDIVEATNDYIVVDKETDSEVHRLKAPYPVLLTMLAEANKPRYMNVKNIMDGFQKDIQVVTNKDLDIPLAKIGLKGSPTKVKKTFVKEVTKKTEKQEVSPEQAVNIILEALSPYRKGLNNE